MAHSKIVVIGASAGGFEAVSAVLGELPVDLPAAVLVVIHTGPGGIVPDAFSRGSALPVGLASDGQPIEERHVYVAPPDRHLIVEDGVVRVARGPREHGFRPAVDPLFISAARAAGPRVAGVVLSGALSDGTAGLSAIKRAGGLTLVQHPDEAAFASMPLSALRAVEVDGVLRLSEIARELAAWASKGTDGKRGRAPRRGTMPRTERGHDVEAPHQLVPFTCPACGGAVWETEELGIPQYECHVGHRYDTESLMAREDERTEDALWTAMRALQEQALLRRRMHARAQERGLSTIARTWLDEAVQAEARAHEVRRLIEGVPGAAARELIDAGDTRSRRNGRSSAGKASRSLVESPRPHRRRASRVSRATTPQRPARTSRRRR